MNLITLSPSDLMISASMVLVVAALSFYMRLGLTASLLIAALRTVIQLLLIGMLLKIIFEQANLAWVALIAFVMLLVAAREITVRQRRRFTGYWSLALGVVSMSISTFLVTLLALLVVIEVEPWYEPQYAIPLLGMMFGNTMNGVALGIDRLTQLVWDQRELIETRLALGEEPTAAINDVVAESARAGMVPIINAMAVAGVVSLPGMMTGQILAGAPPLEAVNYQILIMFMITAGSGLGTFGAVALGARRLFDQRQRLRLDRLQRL